MSSSSCVGRGRSVDARVAKCRWCWLRCCCFGDGGRLRLATGAACNDSDSGSAARGMSTLKDEGRARDERKRSLLVVVKEGRWLTRDDARCEAIRSMQTMPTRAPIHRQRWNVGPCGTWLGCGVRRAAASSQPLRVGGRRPSGARPSIHMCCDARKTEKEKKKSGKKKHHPHHPAPSRPATTAAHHTATSNPHLPNHGKVRVQALLPLHISPHCSFSLIVHAEALDSFGGPRPGETDGPTNEGVWEK